MLDYDWFIVFIAHVAHETYFQFLMALSRPRLGRKLFWQFYDNWDEAVKQLQFRLKQKRVKAAYSLRFD